MIEQVRNIIDLDKLNISKKYSSNAYKVPVKNSLVTISILEKLENGAKVLINGKLFIALLDESLPLKQLIIGKVLKENPFTLSLNLQSPGSNISNEYLSDIILKLGLYNDEISMLTLRKIIYDKKQVIKDKVEKAIEAFKNLSGRINSVEQSLLIHFIWNYSDSGDEDIKDIFTNLFEISFEELCQKLFQCINAFVFTDLPPHVYYTINEKLIYELDGKTEPADDKSEALLEIIRNIESLKVLKSVKPIKILYEKFIKLSLMYILQKAALKEYDYHADFVITKFNSEFHLFTYSVKEYPDSENQLSYKISIKNGENKTEFNGFIRGDNLIGNLQRGDTGSDNIKSLLEILSSNLSGKLNFNSYFNNFRQDYDETANLSIKGFNKLIS